MSFALLSKSMAGRASVSYKLREKVAVVTGGGGVICSAVSMALAEMGAAVAVIDLREGAARKVANSIKKRGGKSIHLRADVTSRESVEGAFKQVLKQLGSVDILINGAGGNLKEATVNEQRSFFEIPLEAVHSVLNLNFIGTFICCQVFGEAIAKKKSGSIVNISSMNAFRPLTGIAAYSAAKAAVTNFTQWLAVHMAQRYSPKIRVNAVAPGFVLTDQNRFLLLDEKGEFTERGRRIVEHTPMGRLGKPEDIVGPVLWLVGDDSAFVTGAVIPADGGFSAFSGV